MVEMRPGWQALGYSTTSVERASGQHAKDLLVIVEEASGVEGEIWDALESLKYSKLVAIGNPIRAEGRFVDLIRQADTDRADGIEPRKAVCAIQIPSTESPHATWKSHPMASPTEPGSKPATDVTAETAYGSARTSEPKFPRCPQPPSSIPHGSISQPLSNGKACLPTTPSIVVVGLPWTWGKGSDGMIPQSL